MAVGKICGENHLLGERKNQYKKLILTIQKMEFRIFIVHTDIYSHEKVDM